MPQPNSQRYNNGYNPNDSRQSYNNRGAQNRGNNMPPQMRNNQRPPQNRPPQHNNQNPNQSPQYNPYNNNNNFNSANNQAQYRQQQFQQSYTPNNINRKDIGPQRKTKKRVNLAELKPGNVSPKYNKPSVIKTRRLLRNRILIALATILAIALAAFYCLSILQLMEPKPAPSPTLLNKIEENNPNIEYNASQKNIETALATINNYYGALSNNDSGFLRSQGWDAAANAIDFGWLAAMEYTLDAPRLTTANAAILPTPIGRYAGCSLYSIADFYIDYPSNSVSSIITGITGPVGWIYFDPLEARWKVVDPTIPTALYAPEATQVGRQSQDQAITTIMTSSGALSNPWWAYMALTVDITAPLDYAGSANVTYKQLDQGITSIVPDSLIRGLVPTRIVNGNTSSDVARASGIIIIQRGLNSNFGVERIGQLPQQLDGNVVPITIQTATEDITPVFLIGTSTSAEFNKLWNKEEMDLYSTSPEKVKELREANEALRQQAISRGEDGTLPPDEPTSEDNADASTSDTDEDSTTILGQIVVEE